MRRMGKFHFTIIREDRSHIIPRFRVSMKVGETRLKAKTITGLCEGIKPLQPCPGRKEDSVSFGPQNKRRNVDEA